MENDLKDQIRTLLRQAQVVKHHQNKKGEKRYAYLAGYYEALFAQITSLVEEN